MNAGCGQLLQQSFAERQRLSGLGAGCEPGGLARAAAAQHLRQRRVRQAPQAPLWHKTRDPSRAR
jgi:hypothetical protein